MEGFNFIHPTKTGGTYFLDTLYENGIIGKPKYHRPKTENEQKPIIFIREPYDRFKSMYKYWKNGGTKYGSNGNITGSVNEFIQLIKSGDEMRGFITWRDHVLPQTHWIRPEDHHKTIAIRYCKDMSVKINALMEHLGIDFRVPSNTPINVSLGEDFELTESQKKFIENFYKDDFLLWNSKDFSCLL